MARPINIVGKSKLESASSIGRYVTHIKACQLRLTTSCCRYHYSPTLVAFYELDLAQPSNLSSGSGISGNFLRDVSRTSTSRRFSAYDTGLSFDTFEHIKPF